MFFWVFFAFIMFFVELSSPGLMYCVSFSIASLNAAAAQWLGAGALMQIVVFLVASSALLCLIHYFVKRSLDSIDSPSNVFALVGKRAVVLHKILPHKHGQVKVGGEQWSASAESGMQLSTGMVVEIVKVIGCHVVVKVVQKNSSKELL